MKAIMISTRPQWVKLILSYIKKDEIRKGSSLYKAINKLIAEQGVAPMLIYCTKDTSKGYLVEEKQHKDYSIKEYELETKKEIEGVNPNRILNGKVVARFNATAEEIKYHFGYYDMEEWTESYILRNSCLTAEELDNYLQASKEYDEKKVSKVYGSDIHINNLKIFDKPKELKEFRYAVCPQINCEYCEYNKTVDGDLYCTRKPLTRAPQSWCYVEV